MTCDAPVNLERAGHKDLRRPNCPMRPQITLTTLCHHEKSAEIAVNICSGPAIQVPGPLSATGSITKNIVLHVRTIQTNASPGSHPQDPPLSDSHATIA